jgi:23S rRNA pseudouridine2605 synthase
MRRAGTGNATNTSSPPGGHTNLSLMQKRNDSRKVGLARALSKLGYCSRTNAANLIRSGEVALNGIIRRDPEFPVHLERDRIDVGGSGVAARVRAYWMLNKPRGLVTTASDEKGRETIYSLLDDSLPWMGPVGRLDKATEGLLLLTNDSEWAARISDPATHLDKTYHVQVRASGADLPVQQFVAGVRAGGEVLRAKRAHTIRSGEKNAWLEIVLDEGKNRQIRRMCNHFGMEVVRLIRTAVGPVTLGHLEKGKARILTADEKEAIDRCLTSTAKPESLHKK